MFQAVLTGFSKICWRLCNLWSHLKVRVCLHGIEHRELLEQQPNLLQWAPGDMCRHEEAL